MWSVQDPSLRPRWIHGTLRAHARNSELAYSLSAMSAFLGPPEFGLSIRGKPQRRARTTRLVMHAGRTVVRAPSLIQFGLFFVSEFLGDAASEKLEVATRPTAPETQTGSLHDAMPLCSHHALAATQAHPKLNDIESEIETETYICTYTCKVTCLYSIIYIYTAHTRTHASVIHPCMHTDLCVRRHH